MAVAIAVAVRVVPPLMARDPRPHNPTNPPPPLLLHGTTKTKKNSTITRASFTNISSNEEEVVDPPRPLPRRPMHPTLPLPSPPAPPRLTPRPTLTRGQAATTATATMMNKTHPPMPTTSMPTPMPTKQPPNPLLPQLLPPLLLLG